MSAAPAIDITGLKAGHGTETVLAVPQLRIGAGERVLVRGASGSGKSTLLGLIAGIALPWQGHISIIGHPLEQLSAAQRDRFRAEHLGVMFQQFNLLPYLSVRDNIALGVAFSSARRARLTITVDDEVHRLLGALGLAPGFAAHRAGQLSVGQQQRVAAARALIGSPSLLLADEPTSALDPDAASSLLTLMFAQCRQNHTTAVVVSHDPQLDALFDRVVVLDAAAVRDCTHA